MDFWLKGRLVLSREIQADDDIKALIEQANKELLKKGLPKHVDPDTGGAKVLSWGLKGSEITLEVRSDRYVRAHDALVRLRKAFSEELGRKHKVGVRDIIVDQYKITFELENQPVEPITLPFVKDISFDGVKCSFTLVDVEQEFLQKNYIDRMIARVKEKAAAQQYQGKAEHWELMEYTGEKEHAWNEDPTQAMLKMHWLKQGPTKGKWFYFPQVTRIMRTMEHIALEEILKPLGFQEVIEPHHVALDIWKRTGHLEGVPNEVYYVCEPGTRDISQWEEFIDHVKITKEIPREMLKDMLAPPNAGICYAQCPVIYWALEGMTISKDSLPLLIYDRTANSNRYESGGRHGIERVDEFHRIEPVYIGTPEQLQDLREKMLDRYRHVLSDILELEWRMAWVTPFYQQQSGEFKEDSGEKVKGTIDFEAYMPYRGTREESEWLEFQNLSIVGEKYTASFNIKSQVQELWSGCSGIGLERWTTAFLAQKGLDPEKWPDAFNKYLGEMPSEITFL